MRYFILMFLFLGACLDLDGLQSGLCGPDRKACFVTQDCKDGTCVNKPAFQADMGTKPIPTFMNFDSCLNYYFPFYQPDWWPNNFFPNNTPKTSCRICSETTNGTCSGRISKVYACRSNNYYSFIEKSPTDNLVQLISKIDILTKQTITEQIVIGSTEICARGNTAFMCDLSNYSTTLCEKL